ncbi:MAG: histidine phosphatase family protein [Reyranellaceae bacterium]
MIRLLLTRHGHVEGIAPERFRGRAELALTERGVAEAAALAKRVARLWKPSIVYTSGLQRCVVTGQAIARACDIEARPLDGLMDIDYGRWQMRTLAEVEAGEPDLYRLWRRQPHRVRFPGGESLPDLVARTAEAVRLVTERHPGETVVLVGHDSVNRAILLQALDQPLSAYWRLAQDPCCLNELEIDGETVRVRRVNDTGHLDPG